MLNRRYFIHQSLLGGILIQNMKGLFSAPEVEDIVMTVNGPIRPSDMKFTLTHEHILADFIGAEKYNRDRYHGEEVFSRALPLVEEVKKKGCVTFIDCSPAYLGRDVLLLKKISDTSGMQMITNTGYYGAVNEKFLPKHAFTESARQLADRWSSEYFHGIEGTGIKPGFIKTSVDKAPLTPTQEKIIEAAGLTHLDTGLTIAIHSGDGMAANEELRILAGVGVSPEARIWVHAQNEPDMTMHVDAAKRKSWVSFDGVNAESIDIHIRYLQNMKSANLLDRVLVSQDSGWYHVGEPNGGDFKNYNCIFDRFIPAMKSNGFGLEEIEKIFVANPAKAFTIRVRKQ